MVVDPGDVESGTTVVGLELHQTAEAEDRGKTSLQQSRHEDRA